MPSVVNELGVVFKLPGRLRHVFYSNLRTHVCVSTALLLHACGASAMHTTPCMPTRMCTAMRRTTADYNATWWLADDHHNGLHVLSVQCVFCLQLSAEHKCIHHRFCMRRLGDV